MKSNEIQDLLNFIANSGLDEVNIETDNLKLAVKRNSGVVAAPVVVAAPAPVVASAPASAAQVTAAPSAAPAPAAEAPSANQIVVKAPMIGTFYRSPSPDKPSFINLGDEIKKGQTLCIIEAMKLFNEIESEYSGKIVKILVENASPVEYDQPLFIVEQA